jgi:hypothetical protein
MQIRYNLWWTNYAQLLSDCVRAKYSKYMIAFVPLTYLSAYFKFSVHFVPSSHLKYVWITQSKCGSVTQLVQLKEFACDTYSKCVNTKVILTYPNHTFYLCGKIKC